MRAVIGCVVWAGSALRRSWEAVFGRYPILTVVVTDEREIPLAYWREPPAPPPVLDKVAIKEALKRGDYVQGAHLEQKTRLEIK